MEKGRLEAFTDGVIAVIITIMVLELKPPHEATLPALLANWPVFASYVLSFIYVAIYWNNHHHLMHLAERINGRVMWANLHMLFWISLFPFTTAWLNEAHGAHGEFPAPLPTLVYGIVLLLSALAWIPLSRSLIACNGGRQGALARALGSGWKEKASPAIYLVAIASSFFAPIVSCVLYVVVALIWIVPDRRIERHLISNP
ncbi:MAG: DUF1211 domain-containing protein [Proteobacteria bacterium]|nr:DUF1211 domain-containing protein [Pseudomonadota bacterium]